MNLFQANHQWSTRPEDERFSTPEEMRNACFSYAMSSVSATVKFDDLNIVSFGDELKLRGKSGSTATFTHYAFGQLCARTEAPASFLRSLPASLTADVLNNRIATVAGSKYDARLLFQKNDSNLVVRSMTSELYDRVWNYELLDRGVIPMVREYGWRVPPARPAFSNQKGTRIATVSDILPNQGDFGLAVKEGDMIAPAGLYASDHDMFAFLVHTDRVVKAGNRALMRGCFFRNSEVGDGALEGTFFLLDNVCGNHIVWGAENVHSVRVRHVAGKDMKDSNASLKRFAKQWFVEMKTYENSSSNNVEDKISSAMNYEIAGTKEEIIDTIFKYARAHSLPAITKSRIDAAYETAVLHEGWYGNPRSVWGIVSGLTENSQGSYSDVRDDVDRQAGKVLEIAF